MKTYELKSFRSRSGSWPAGISWASAACGSWPNWLSTPNAGPPPAAAEQLDDEEDEHPGDAEPARDRHAPARHAAPAAAGVDDVPAPARPPPAHGPFLPDNWFAPRQWAIRGVAIDHREGYAMYIGVGTIIVILLIVILILLL